MDPFSIAIGSLSLISVISDLNDNIAKLRQLCQDFYKAPDILEDLMTQMTANKALLQQLEPSEEDEAVDSQVLQQYIKNCQHVNSEISGHVTKMASMMHDSKVKGRLHVVLKQPAVVKLSDKLYKAKQDLALALDVYTMACRRRDMITLMSMLQSIQKTTSQHDLALKQIAGWHDLARLSLSNPETSNIDVLEKTYTSYNTKHNSLLHESRDLEPNKNARITRKRLFRTPRWLSSVVWEISIACIQDDFSSSWSIVRCARRPVPADWGIFEACMQGRLPLVRSLIETGRASFHDYTEDTRVVCTSKEFHYIARVDHLIELAVLSMNYGLCQYVLKHGPAADHQSVSKALVSLLEPGFLWTYSSPALARHFSIAQLLAVYRLLQPYFAYETADAEWITWQPKLWHWCDSINEIELCRETFGILEATMSWQTKFDALIENEFRGTFQPPEVRNLLNMFGLDEVTTALACTRGTRGRTFLQLVARHISKLNGCSAKLSSYTSLLQDLLHHGADLHHQDHHGLTALTMLLTSGYDMEGLRRWLEALRLLQIDLLAYGVRESTVWQEHQKSACCAVLCCLKLGTYGSVVSDWSFGHDEYADEPFQVSVYLPAAIPGTFKPLPENNVWELPWRPENEDELPDGWHWQLSRTVDVPALRTLDVDYTPVKRLRVQDDAGTVMLLSDRARKHSTVIRSSSCRAAQRLERRHADPVDSSWRIESHLCTVDGKWRIGGPGKSARSCSKHNFLEDYEALWTSYDGINAQMRRFRQRYVDRAALDALPYAAYRPIWERERQNTR